MPAKDTHTPVRHIRIPDDVWEAARADAEERGTSVSAIINTYLRRKYGTKN